jgi:hypothetical protein
MASMRFIKLTDLNDNVVRVNPFQIVSYCQYFGKTADDRRTIVKTTYTDGSTGPGFIEVRQTAGEIDELLAAYNAATWGG